MTLSKRDRRLKRKDRESGRMEIKHREGEDEQEAGAELKAPFPACVRHVNERRLM